MLLRDCPLEQIDAIHTAELQWNEPEARWCRARDSESIPLELFNLYAQLGYLSFVAGPLFLHDDKNVIFSYFAMALNCVLDNLDDARLLKIDLTKDHGLLYDFLKKARGESWEPEAQVRFNRNLRDVLIVLDGTLDTVADLVALILTGRWKITKLTLGRGDFQSIHSWLEKDFATRSGPATPYDSQVRNLYDVLRPLVVCDPPEQDWLGLTHILRNKTLHFGKGMLRQVGLYDSKPEFHLFIPREWPFIYERYLRTASSTVPHDPVTLRRLFTDSLIHQDILAFVEGLHRRVMQITPESMHNRATHF